ncbi:MAG: hypothetical protein ABJD24_11775 [Acidimicrobiales bacterium]
MAERGEPWPADEDVVGRTTLISQRALVVSSLFVALAAGVGVAQALPVPDTAMQRVAWWLVAETAALAAVSAMQLLMRRRRLAAALAPAGLALVIVLTAVAVVMAAPAPERPRDLVVTLGADTEIGLSSDAVVEAAAVEAAAVIAPVPVTEPPTPTTVVVAVLPTEPPTTAAPPTSIAGAAPVVGAVVPNQAVPTVPAAPPPPEPTAPPATDPPTTVSATTAPATTAPPTTVAANAQVLVSLSADRSAPVAAMGATVPRGSNIYMFVDPAAEITRVRFWFGSKKGSPDHVENSAPFDLAGTASDGNANPYTVSGSTGSFSITVEVTFANGSISTSKVTLKRV